MDPHTEIAAGNSTPTGPRRPLDELGDLFFSARTAAAPPAPAAHGVNALLVQPRRNPQPDDPFAALQGRTEGLPVEVTAVLAGGLPPERRLDLARHVARRLAAPATDPPLVVFSGQTASVEALGDSRADEKLGPAGIGAALRHRATEAGQLILLVGDRAAAYLDDGRRLPDHCVIPVIPDNESLLEAYRELKTAVRATTGPVPEVFVVEAGSTSVAERTYRRLARVAIAHLGCTPTFAGRALERVDPGHDDAAALHTLVAGADAGHVYRMIVPLLADAGGEPAAPGAAETHQAAPAVEVRESEPADGLRQTLPPVAGVVSGPPAPTEEAVFTTWQPADRAELHEAARASLKGLLPGAQGTIPLDGLVEASECPDLVAVDTGGALVGLLVARGSDPVVLRRAAQARSWLASYAALLARAFPEAGIDPAADPPRSVALVPEAAAAELAALCPVQVALAAYTPVACGPVRGLLLREVLWPVEIAPAEARGWGAAAATPPAPEKKSAKKPPETPSTRADPAAKMAASMKGDAAAETTDPSHEPIDELEAPGTSPDDDLSADEINDLTGAFEIDELT